jgi:hypothetical protein
VVNVDVDPAGAARSTFCSLRAALGESKYELRAFRARLVGLCGRHGASPQEPAAGPRV